MPTAEYTVGQEIRLEGAFTDPGNNNAPVDPTTVAFKVRDGKGTLTTYDTPVKDSTGVYHQDIVVGKPTGVWHSRVEGTGAAVGAAESLFLVLPTNF